MVKHEGTNDGQTTTIALEAPVRLEPRIAPMWLCCGHWSYGLSLSAFGFTASLTWIEDGDAACSGILFD